MFFFSIYPGAVFEKSKKMLKFYDLQNKKNVDAIILEGWAEGRIRFFEYHSIFMTSFFEV